MTFKYSVFSKLNKDIMKSRRMQRNFRSKTVGTSGAFSKALDPWSRQGIVANPKIFQI